MLQTDIPGTLIHTIGKGRQFHIRVFGQCPVQGTEKVITVTGIGLPGILTVQHDRHHTLVTVRAFAGNIFKMMHKVTDRIIPVPSRIGKTDQVRKPVIAKETHRATLTDTIGTMQTGFHRLILRQGHMRQTVT